MAARVATTATKRTTRYEDMDLVDKFSTLAKILHKNKKRIDDEWDKFGAQTTVVNTKKTYVYAMDLLNYQFVLTHNEGNWYQSNTFGIFRVIPYLKINEYEYKKLKGTTYKLVNLIAPYGWSVIASYTPYDEDKVRKYHKIIKQLLSDEHTNYMPPKARTRINKKKVYVDIEDYVDECMRQFNQ